MALASGQWVDKEIKGHPPSPRFNHTTALLGEQIYMFGGSSAEDSYYKDIYILDIGTLAWQKCEVKGDSPSGSVSQTFTAHYDKDIYLFGGRCESKNGTTTNEIQKLSIAKMKWKVPLYVGIPPARRHGHAAFILHSHIYIIGGANEEQEFNDVKVMKLINPSERQPIMKEILSEFGIQGVSNGFAPTKVPKVKYELTESPFPARIDSPPPIQKSELFQATIAFQYEKEAYNTQRQKQQQELKEMLEKHKAQNEAWLKARAEENDRERKELCKLREEVLHEQEKLKEEQSNIQKRSEQLLSIMQQFKGM
ncbi:UNVERIFIED_CONTAM: hypothetical protein FKN15_075812 [Acipenser sinensis]